MNKRNKRFSPFMPLSSSSLFFFNCAACCALIAQHDCSKQSRIVQDETQTFICCTMCGFSSLNFLSFGKFLLFLFNRVLLIQNVNKKLKIATLGARFLKGISGRNAQMAKRLITSVLCFLRWKSKFDQANYTKTVALLMAK